MSNRSLTGGPELQEVGLGPVHKVGACSTWIAIEDDSGKKGWRGAVTRAGETRHRSEEYQYLKEGREAAFKERWEAIARNRVLGDCGAIKAKEIEFQKGQCL